jgi:hypothetical protein
MLFLHVIKVTSHRANMCWPIQPMTHHIGEVHSKIIGAGDPYHYKTNRDERFFNKFMLFDQKKHEQDPHNPNTWWRE